MRANLGRAALTVCLLAFGANAALSQTQVAQGPPLQTQPQQGQLPSPQTPPPAAQPAPAPVQPSQPAQARSENRTFSPDELIGEGHHFFGTVSRGLAEVVEKAVSNWGQPNGYILGQEGGGALMVGLRYGDGKLYTKNAGDKRVFWEGPSIGFDAGADGARTMMLVYKLPATEAIYQRFVGIDGSAYFIGGFGMTALAADNIIVVPIRSGVGFRLGANLGYLKFTPQATWNPF